jgi:KUP system potassium uptake protein
MTTSNSMPAAATAGHAAKWVGLAALGVVFGDLGTSPLYTLQTIVQAMGGRFTPASAIGILSLIVWTLILTISVKYCLFVMRADNRGEGGILALMSLIGANGFTRGIKVLTGTGLLGAALIYDDGIITPAISVLSAVEGVNVATDTLKPFVMPMGPVVVLDDANFDDVVPLAIEAGFMNSGQACIAGTRTCTSKPTGGVRSART